jgi:hypothetical protein
MSKLLKSLYVVAQKFPNTDISIIDECVFETKAEAEAEKANTLKLYQEMRLNPGKLEVMTLEDYIKECSQLAAECERERNVNTLMKVFS